MSVLNIIIVGVGSISSGNCPFQRCRGKATYVHGVDDVCGARHLYGTTGANTQQHKIKNTRQTKKHNKNNKRKHMRQEETKARLKAMQNKIQTKQQK